MEMKRITNDRTTTQTMAGTGHVLTVTRHGSVIVDGLDENIYGISVPAEARLSKVIVDGLVRATHPDNGTSVGIWSDAANFRLIIGKSGHVEGGDGVVVNAKTNVWNYGDIVGLEGSGISAPGHIKIENTGHITGVQGVSMFRDGAVVNDGVITGSDIGILAENDHDYWFWNRGTINGLGSAAIQSSVGKDTVRNYGTIIGDVSTGDGDDKIMLYKGSAQGDIITGAGDDRLIVTTNKFNLIEESDGGFDEVNSTVSYTLPDYVEILNLFGTKNINGTGSENGGNYISGNRGDNVLNGLGGHNWLFGNGGTDTLIGGDDHDVFGIGKYDGHDTVENYQDGTDQIDIWYLGPDNFEELKSRIKDHGNDTWIEYAHTALILKGVDHNVLDESDFLFNQ